MTRKIDITSGQIRMEAELNRTGTADLILEQLPLTGRVNTWGDEIYFAIPVSAKPENAVSAVEVGDLAYWPEGRAFCIFFGRTPASTAEEIRPASPVNPIGRLLGDPKAWKAVKAGEKITLKKADRINVESDS